MTEKQPAVGTERVFSQLWKWNLIAGLLTAVLGAVVLAWPGPSIVVASTLFGVYLLVSGIAYVFAAFALSESVPTRVLLFISGALSVVLAILSFRHLGDGYAVLLLSLWIGIGFVFQGVSAAVVGASVPGLAGRGWYIAYGIVSAIAGLIVLAWPFDSIAALTVVGGIWLVIMGVTEVVHSFQVRKDVNTARDTVEALVHPVAA